MSITEKALQKPKLTEQKQRLLGDLSREIAALNTIMPVRSFQMQNLEEKKLFRNRI
ncbi:MAG: hypothetical protein CM1200mP10_01850 [Candidatus Neomarinimicrobiota bacterium]|nr:MAG: hypothetical protein CM1200mP10_01850 [Candidatus Neomarinimicrobiota bacterium]